MHSHRSARQPSLPLALVTAAVSPLVIPAAAPAQGDAYGVEIPLPAGSDTSQEPSGVGRHPVEAAPSAQVIDSGGASRVIVVTVAPPPVAGQEQPPRIGFVGLDRPGKVLVYSPPSEPVPGWRKLRGVDIRYHRMAEAREPRRVTAHSWEPGAVGWIRYHDGRSSDRTRIPYARTGSALAAQSWNANGARFRAPRIRYHGWTRGRGDGL